ncbi:X-Pro dipeptidyl-peptidase (S15 family) protein, partial [Metarhizium brunneum ARSEF 3297]
MSAISIKKGSIQLSGLLYKPSTTSKTPGIVVVHPGGGVKEQTARLYAKKLSEAGLTAIAYDASYQGESEGEPHFLEDPAERVSDVFAVIDYLESLDTVDPSQLGILGICAGGGYAVAAAKADHRLKSVAAISMSENKTGNLGACPYVPPQLDDKTPLDLREAHDYYLGPRCQHPRAANKMLFRSVPRVMTFDAFYLADLYLTQPLLLIAGEKAGSIWHTDRLDKLVGGATRKVIVPGCTHMDLYDRLPFVDVATKEVVNFMKTYLK